MSEAEDYEDVDLRVDIYTALPFLRFLYALEGRFDYEPEFPTAWRAFRRFMSIETAVDEVGATFQVYPAEEGTGFDLFFGRQLRDPEVEEAIFGLHFFFDVGQSQPELELWSSDFLDEDRFFGDVESSAPFSIAMKKSAFASSFHVSYPGEDL